MAEDLGEVRVNIESEGAEDAAETIGDAAGESDGGEQGGIGGLLGGISAKLAGILGFVGFLASLKPIQELLSGLQRLFSIAILPLVSLLTTFLRPILQQLLRFISELDFNNLIQSLVTNLRTLFNNIGSDISQQISRSIPGVGTSTSDQIVKAGGQGLERSTENVLGTGTGLGSGTVNIALDWLNEQANTSLESNAAGRNAEVVQNEGVGPE